MNKRLWRWGWARYHWLKCCRDFDPIEVENEEPWYVKYRDVIETGIGINEDELDVSITFPKGIESLQVHVYIRDPSTSNQFSAKPRTDEDIRNTMKFDGVSRQIAALEFYTSSSGPSPWAAFGSAPHIEPWMLSADCLQKIFGWLRPCVLWHKACAQQPWKQQEELNASQPPKCKKPHKLKRALRRVTGHSGEQTTQALEIDDGFPARLLKLELSSDESSPPIVRLEDTTNPEAIYRYVALSHVWAYTEPCATTKSNHAAHTKSVPWAQLSLALRETIFVTVKLELDIEYVWIDSLCIIQDDIIDKRSELPRMSLIYGRAEIVFAVHGPDLGMEKVALQPIQDPNRPEDPPVYCRKKQDHVNLLSEPKDPSSWLGRAWCMQERIFAPRILHFGGREEEIYFECNTLLDCECGQMRSSDGSNVLTMKGKLAEALVTARSKVELTDLRNEAWRIYISVCENYTPRGITYPGDKLSAVSSLMRTFMPYLGMYYAGLWEHNLIVSLQWEAFDTGHCKRYDSYVAPSFSWASISGAVIWYIEVDKLPTPETHEFASVVEISSTLDGIDPCGPVSSGHITLRGHTTNMNIDENKLMCMPDGRIEMRKAGAKNCYVTLDSKEDYEKLEPGLPVKCLNLMQDKKGLHGNFVSGLVLRPANQESSRYVRIGFSTMLMEHFEDSVLETVTIV